MEGSFVAEGDPVIEHLEMSRSRVIGINAVVLGGREIDLPGVKPHPFAPPEMSRCLDLMTCGNRAGVLGVRDRMPGDGSVVSDRSDVEPAG